MKRYNVRTSVPRRLELATRPPDGPAETPLNGYDFGDRRTAAAVDRRGSGPQWENVVVGEGGIRAIVIQCDEQWSLGVVDSTGAYIPILEEEPIGWKEIFIPAAIIRQKVDDHARRKVTPTQ